MFPSCRLKTTPGVMNGKNCRSACSCPLYELEYRSEESLQLTRRAIFAAQSASAPESLYRWHWPQKAQEGTK